MADDLHAPHAPMPARPRPEPWAARRARVARRWVLPFVFSEWLSEWAAYGLSRWTFLEVLDHAGRLSILIALIVYVAEAPDRRKQKHYQAWQVINSAQGAGGSGGRTEAMQELNEDHVPLAGVNVARAFLQGLRLPGAELRRADFTAADARGADLSGADLQDGEFGSINLRGSALRRADLHGADLNNADLHGADLSGADLSRCNLAHADLGDADLAGVKWEGIADIHEADLTGVRNAPAGFLEWAAGRGAAAPAATPAATRTSGAGEAR